METFVAKHIPELDGLRGIAILSVIVHHKLTPFSLRGGFLGVDLFFVLSGFLITSLLLGEFGKTGLISLKKFYMRRLLRLGPALLIYLAAALLVTYHTQLIDLTRQLKLIAIAVFYSTNWRMAFGWDKSLDPTSIIWSLSIEEQFYLVWPLLLFGCLALKVGRRYIVSGLVVVILAILVHRYLLLDAAADLTRLYYGTDTRADALLVGCVFAFLNVTATAWKTINWLNVAGICSAVSLVILVSTADFSDQFLYRGGFTGIALLSGIVILVASNSPPWIFSALLRSGLLRWFGKISYGLYLWHWLVVRSTSLYYLGYWEPWAKLAIAVGIAAASFYLVERPFNKLKTRFAIKSSRSRTTAMTMTSDKEASRHLPLAFEP
jgi:peptidoglycan/LPS O-acetylase OafA/YrhL